jgi:2-oxo-4-hydroxy-4-carboxy-5-ureidoimidazoline decarboxylase
VSAAGVARLNALAAPDAEAELIRCCGSTAWARAMAAARPFAGEEALLAAADETWWALDEADWREAFSRHPRIGEARAARPAEGTEAWSRQEQRGMDDAGGDVKAALAEANRAYEARFGWIYLVCATGRSAEEMLELCRARLGNEPAAEMRVAAAEQAKITRIRLEKALA